MSKLNKLQKNHLKQIDNPKQRKKLKKQFKKANENKIFDVIQCALEEIFRRLTEPKNHPLHSFPNMVNYLKTDILPINKEDLNSILNDNPSIEMCKDLKDFCINHQEYEFAKKFREKEKELTNLTETPQPKTYTLEDMENCFYNARKYRDDHPYTKNFKYIDFGTYLNSL